MTLKHFTGDITERIKNTYMKKKIKNPTSKELSVLEKQMDIKTKRVELRNMKYDFDVYEPRRVAVDEQSILIQKVSQLSALLYYTTIDEEKTILGSEPICKSILDDEERKMVKEKLKELLNKF